MKWGLSHKMMFFVLVAAYLALLAHAFVPHHHHGEQTAFLNHKTCPHEHHDHENAVPIPDSCHGSECETLKNVWVKDNQQKQNLQAPPEHLDLNYFLGFDFPFLWEGWAYHGGFAFQDVSISSDQLQVASNALRGPPIRV